MLLKSPLIPLKSLIKIHFKQTIKAMQRKRFSGRVPWKKKKKKKKKFGTKKIRSRSNCGVTNLQLAEISGTHLLTAFLESDPRLHCFRKLSLSWELGSSLWKSEHACYEEEWVLSRKLYFSFNPQQKVLEPWAHLISFVK